MRRRSVIFTKLLLGVALATGLLYTAADAMAQRMSITIPFAFTANHQSLPAGFYEVEMVSNRYMALRNIVTEERQVLMVHPAEGEILEAPGHMVFVRVGQQFHLNQVRLAGKSNYSNLVVQHKAPQELATRLTPAGATVEVAFK